MDIHKTLYPFYITKKTTHVTATITKNAFRCQRYPGPGYTTIIYTVGQRSPNFFVRWPHKLFLKVSRAGHYTHT